MRIALPAEAVQVPLQRHDEAVRTFAAIMAKLRDAPDGSSGDLEAAAAEAVETAVRGGAFLMAVLAPPGCGAALLTGVMLDVPDGWDADSTDSAEQLRESLENVGGPDVRETATMRTGLGLAVIANRVPGVEQARARKPMTLQLQALIPEPGQPRMLLLTLAAPQTLGWDRHQALFAAIVASAQPDRAADPATDPAREPAAETPVEQPKPAPARRRPAPVEDETFENITYQL
ncbi:hypothetical protein [Labedaea rhizosphaerae]|uniref:Uncharacterized protein n=1 Tax=Labedaea rhizosphaerae TaxID=598644 RepID=A0A4R6SD82_LABRH|nr:hypothetical protein [Labedaea rhizosphaerae]TDP97573.1 hypothetical protein EV186_103537 [Labedaea rhizosphaerae]